MCRLFVPIRSIELESPAMANETYTNLQLGGGSRRRTDSLADYSFSKILAPAAPLKSTIRVIESRSASRVAWSRIIN